MVARIRVDRKGFVTKKGTRVMPTSFLIKDRGAPGRGKKVLPELKKGTLGISFSESASVRRRKLVVLAKRIGEKKVMGKLQALVVFNKRTNPVLSKKASSDRRFVASSFVGKKRVRTGTGLSKNKNVGG